MKISSWLPALGALLVITIPVRWLLAALLAACVHELCHIAAVMAFDGKLSSVRIGVTGAEISANIRGRRKERIAILVGPVGSFLLCCFVRTYPEIAVCGLIQGMFNLLPLFPLDGGRLIRLILEQRMPDNAERMICVIESICCWFLFVCMLSVSCICRFQDVILIAEVVCIIRGLSCEKGLEKRGKSGYNSPTIL